MRVRVYFGPIGKSPRRFVVAPQARISFRDIPKDRGVARIEFLRFFEIRQRIFPTALAPIDRLYASIFEGILGERISTRPVEIVNPFPWHGRK